MIAAAASRALPGENENGDGWLVVGPVQVGGADRAAASSVAVGDGGTSAVDVSLDARGPTLLAVVDGTGHGPAAAGATARILGVLADHCDHDLPVLLRECHAAALGSRGAAVSLALVDPRIAQIRFMGIGNVTGQLVVRHAEGPPSWTRLTRPSTVPAGVAARTFVNNAGIVGYQFPAHLIDEVADFEPGDALVMFSDGMAPDFDPCEFVVEEPGSPAMVAHAMLSRCARGADDATALVCR